MQSPSIVWLTQSVIILQFLTPGVRDRLSADLLHSLASNDSLECLQRQRVRQALVPLRYFPAVFDELVEDCRAADSGQRQQGILHLIRAAVASKVGGPTLTKVKSYSSLYACCF